MARWRLRFDPHQPRDSHGRWVLTLDAYAHRTNPVLKEFLGRKPTKAPLTVDVEAAAKPPGGTKTWAEASQKGLATQLDHRQTAGYTVGLYQHKGDYYVEAQDAYARWAHKFKSQEYARSAFETVTMVSGAAMSGNLQLNKHHDRYGNLPKGYGTPFG